MPGTDSFGHSRYQLSGACRCARGRCDGHVGEEFLRDHLHKRPRISGFLQRPLDAVAEARLLVEIRPVFGSESADARKYSIERLHRLFRRLFARQVRARLREAPQQLLDDRVCEFVDVLRREPIQQRSEEHTSELQSRVDLVCRLLLEKKDYRDTNDNVDIDDLMLKGAYRISKTDELSAAFHYYEAHAGMPGGLTPEQFAANPFQSTRP